MIPLPVQFFGADVFGQHTGCTVSSGLGFQASSQASTLLHTLQLLRTQYQWKGGVGQNEGDVYFTG